MAEHSFGYGRCDAPFWFIGSEAGMARSGHSLKVRYESWKLPEFAPVVDYACCDYRRIFKAIT
jgi:hypothetical protein